MSKTAISKKMGVRSRVASDAKLGVTSEDKSLYMKIELNEDCSKESVHGSESIHEQEDNFEKKLRSMNVPVIAHHVSHHHQ